MLKNFKKIIKKILFKFNILYFIFFLMIFLNSYFLNKIKFLIIKKIEFKNYNIILNKIIFNKKKKNIKNKKIFFINKLFNKKNKKFYNNIEIFINDDINIFIKKIKKKKNLKIIYNIKNKNNIFLINNKYDIISTFLFKNNNKKKDKILIKYNVKEKYYELLNFLEIFIYYFYLLLLLFIFILYFINKYKLNQFIKFLYNYIYFKLKNNNYYLIDNKYKYIFLYKNKKIKKILKFINRICGNFLEFYNIIEIKKNCLDVIIKKINNGIIITDILGKVIIINDFAIKLLNINKNKVLGISILKILDIENKFSLENIIKKNKNILINFKINNKKILILNIYFEIIKNSFGFIEEILVILFDVTNNKQDDYNIQTLVANISHELKTPLTSIKSYIETLNDGIWKDYKLAPRFLKIVSNETERLIRMVNNLLNIYKMDINNLNFEYINFNKLFNFVLNRFELIILNSNKKNKIIRKFTNKILWINVDSDKIIQVLDNILNNAMKYSYKNGQIICKLFETNNNIIISISDEGFGIPKKDIDNIFDRFYRVDKARTRFKGGAGLGLFIAKSIIIAHNGVIWVKSIYKKGTIFYISLPYDNTKEELFI